MEGKCDEVLACKCAAWEARGATTNKDAKGKMTAATGKPSVGITTWLGTSYNNANTV
jgi:hypothetical protein